ncbi:HotDog domain-containing protein [Aspergillus unguis]
MPAYTPIPTYSRHPKPATGEDGFFAQTLSSSITIPSVHTFRNSTLNSLPSQPPPWPSPIDPPQLIPVGSDSDLEEAGANAKANANANANAADLLMLLQLASPGVCGHPSMAHGGVLATVIDEAMSLGVTLYAPEAAEDYQVPQEQGQAQGGGRIRSKMFTAQLDVRYKKPVSVPGEIEVRVKVLAKQGKKLWVRAQVVQKGEIMVDAVAFWLLTLKSNL